MSRIARAARGTIVLAALLPRFLGYDSRHGATASHPDLIEAL